MKKLINILLLFMVVFAGCKTKKTDEQEIQKLLDRQAQQQESQKESLDKLQQIKDSLAVEKDMLVKERDQKDEKVKLLEKNQQILVEELKKEEETDISSEKTRLQEQISGYEDSIEQLKDELSVLDADIDSIENSMGFYEVQEEQAEKLHESGIDEIDQRINKLENQKQQEIKKADLVDRRILISEKKIEAYKMEREMYVDERDELLRTNASEEKLEPYRKKIAEMDSIISAEEKNKQAIINELNKTKQWISDVDTMINDLQTKIKQEYDERKIIEGFISSEKERLQNEIDNLQTTREKLVNEQEQISDELSGVEQQIASLNKKMELIKNKEMSDLLEQQAEIEQSEAALAEEEVRLLEESKKLDTQSVRVTSDAASEELKGLVELGNQIDSLRASVKEEKAEIAKTRKELSEKRAEAAEKRARFGRTLVTLIVIIVVGDLGLLTLFYYLGKRARKS